MDDSPGEAMTGTNSDPLRGVDPEDLKAWDRQHVWHPFTPMTAYRRGSAPVIARAEGFRLQDVDGNWYLDGSSSIWLNVHGHRNPRLDQAIRSQLDHIAHSTLLGQGNAVAALLARRLVEATPPGLEHVFFSDSGATAVEIALKAAIQWFANQGQKRHKILGFTNNYHGDTMGAMSVAPDPVFHWPFLEMLQDQPRLPYPYWFHYPDPVSTPEEAAESTLSSTRQLFSDQGDQIAAVIIEPVEGAGGICPAPEGFLKSLAGLCTEHGILLIVDEVATGFGKTGTMFACEAEGITPDLLCLGKGLTGGYLPVAATLATGRVFEQFLGERRRTLFHGHSFTGNQLGCAAALASLELMPEAMASLPPKIARLWSRAEALDSLPLVSDVRGRGIMMGIELGLDRETREPIPPERLAGYRVTDRARELGLLVRPIGNTVIFMPPVATPLELLDEMFDRLQRAMEEVLPELALELK
jgi:adenosylmethionine-8-amino-7-oxononanoate aminotransferase